MHLYNEYFTVKSFYKNKRCYSLHCYRQNGLLRQKTNFSVSNQNNQLKQTLILFGYICRYDGRN